MRMLKDKDIRPVSPITTYSVSDLYKAFRLVETGRYLGEVIVQPHQGELVKVSPFKRLDPVLQLIGFLGSLSNRGNKAPYHCILSRCWWPRRTWAICLPMVSRVWSQKHYSSLWERQISGKRLIP